MKITNKLGSLLTNRRSRWFLIQLPKPPTHSFYRPPTRQRIALQQHMHVIYGCFREQFHVSCSQQSRFSLIWGSHKWQCGVGHFILLLCLSGADMTISSVDISLSSSHSRTLLALPVVIGVWRADAGRNDKGVSAW